MNRGSGRNAIGRRYRVTTRTCAGNRSGAALAGAASERDRRSCSTSTARCSIWRRRRAKSGCRRGWRRRSNRLHGANQRRAGAGQRPLAQRYRSDFRARSVSGRRRPRRGDADRAGQRSGRRPCAADGQGIEAPAGGDRKAEPGNICWKTRAIRWRCIIAWRRMRRRRSMRRCR